MQNAGYAKDTSQKPQSVFNGLINQYAGLNDFQEKMLYEIEEKLHELYNQRTPSGKEGLGDIAMETDALGRIGTQLNRHTTANQRIEKILAHLNTIV